MTRKPKTPSNLKRTTIGLPDSLHATMMAAAKANESSMSAEIARRLMDWGAAQLKVSQMRSEVSSLNDANQSLLKDMDATKSRIDAMKVNADIRNKDYDDLQQEYYDYRIKVQNRNSNAWKRFMNIFRG